MDSGKELTITDDHGVIVVDNESNKKIVKANNLKVGQKLITLDGPQEIKTINNLKVNDYEKVENDSCVYVDGSLLSWISVMQQGR